MRDYRGTGKKIEPKSAWAYIFLTCGRITTPDEQEFYSVWKPRRGLYFCEVCHNWRDKVKGATFASHRTEGPGSGPCANRASIPMLDGCNPGKPGHERAVSMHVAIPGVSTPYNRHHRCEQPEKGHQIPLPGMPDSGTP